MIENVKHWKNPAKSWKMRVDLQLHSVETIGIRLTDKNDFFWDPTRDHNWIFARLVSLPQMATFSLTEKKQDVQLFAIICNYIASTSDRRHCVIVASYCTVPRRERSTSSVTTIIIIIIIINFSQQIKQKIIRRDGCGPIAYMLYVIIC